MMEAEVKTDVEVSGKPAPITKEAFVDKLVEVYGRIFGKRISRNLAWVVYKAGFQVSFELAQHGIPVSLAGVGKFEVMDSQRSVQKGKPAKRMRFRTSTAVNDGLNTAGHNFLAELYAKTEAVAKDAPTETGTTIVDKGGVLADSAIAAVAADELL